MIAQGKKGWWLRGVRGGLLAGLLVTWTSGFPDDGY